MTGQQKSNKYLLLSIIWTIITMVMLFTPESSIEVDRTFFIPGMDKVVHFILFAIWTFLVAKAYSERQKMTPIMTLGIVFLLLAIATEVIQHYIGRTFEMKDILADVSGSIIGLLIFKRV